ncbi:hypothetical protein B4U80_01266 [Leptotrombidium deliense]|uniref:Uncharacterized protein n=1 Tax=Leptotrombidium deliense TaxID=299467 RepID=A0A443SMR8_9ACAR|nr:hypothetical protein B4U80_01266 [Leptotrombidium deliense]
MKLRAAVITVFLFEALVFTSSASRKTNSVVNTLKSPLFKALVTDTLAYVASPLFMPIAIGRALTSPVGLGTRAHVVSRFGRYLRNTVAFKKNSSRKQSFLIDDFINKMTKYRVNSILTLKQFRELERSSKLQKSNTASKY